jgi:Ni/Fe-hydrogenase 1 B-type cytochrome subunit
VDTRIAQKEWSLALRANHWIMVMAIVGLIVTGFYIARPFTVQAGETIDKFMMGYVRYFHLMFGITLTFVFIWRIYLMFFSKFHADWKDFLAWTDFRNFWTQIKFYTFLSQKKPDHNYLYGPLQSLAYGGLLFMLLVLVLTGLILSGVDYSGGFIGIAYLVLSPLKDFLGGLAVVRFIHHIFTWLVILFIVVHVYMAFWYDIVFKEGTISSMIGGRIFRKPHE